MWQQWLAVAEESRQVASFLQTAEGDFCYRAAINRFYYSAYQAGVALLHYAGHIPPKINDEQYEGWTHEAVRDLIEYNVSGRILSRREKVKIANTLKQLYKSRQYADYIPSVEATLADVLRVRRESGRILKMVQQVISGGRQAT